MPSPAAPPPDTVLARVAAPDPAIAREHARAAAGDRAAAVRIARRYIALARQHADPRYHGRAQAVLARWWHDDDAPDDVVLLRATIRQAVHEFAAARGDLDRLVARGARDPQIRLTRAAVATVMGDFAVARADCAAIAESAGELIAAACDAPLAMAGGDLQTAYDRLAAASAGGAAPGIAAWASTTLGEVARQRGDDAAAERHFRSALAIAPTDTYCMAQLADLLLDGNRAADAADLLRGAAEADGLLLRLAIAERRAGDPAGAVHASAFAERMDATLARGDTTHMRERARQLLDLDGDARGALAAALDNWNLQHEPADARLVIDAAVAAGRPEAAATVTRWLDDNRIRDAVIDRARARLP
jgi:hypothetical protein